MKEKQLLHVFDVDGTLTAHDSFLLLLRYALPSFTDRAWAWITGVPVMFRCLIMADAAPLKLHLLNRMWQGKPGQLIDEQCRHFFDEVMKDDLRQHALDHIAALRTTDRPATIVLLSAGCKEWLQWLAKYLDADLICTELSYDERGCFDGRFATPNCKGKEKVRRLLQRYPLEWYDFICYGDAAADKALRSVSQQLFYRYF